MLERVVKLCMVGVILGMIGYAVIDILFHPPQKPAIVIVDSTIYLTVPTIINDTAVPGVPSNKADIEKLAYTIEHTLAKTIIINWAGQGGEVSLGIRLISAIQYAQAEGKQIIIHLTGPAYSMHADIVCYADAISIPSGTFLYFHAARYLDKDHHVNYVSPLNVESYLTEVSLFDQCVDKGLLSKDDEQTILKQHMAVIVYNDHGKLKKAIVKDE